LFRKKSQVNSGSVDNNNYTEVGNKTAFQCDNAWRRMAGGQGNATVKLNLEDSGAF
jgi:hypothetical protein